MNVLKLTKLRILRVLARFSSTGLLSTSALLFFVSVLWFKPWQVEPETLSQDPAMSLRAQIATDIEKDILSMLSPLMPKSWENLEDKINVDVLVNLRPSGRSRVVSRIKVDISFYDRHNFESLEGHARRHLNRELNASKYRAWVWPQSDILSFEIFQHRREYIDRTAYLAWAAVLLFSLLFVFYIIIETFFFWKSSRKIEKTFGASGPFLPVSDTKNWDESTFHVDDIAAVASEKISPKLMQMPLGQLRDLLTGMSRQDQRKVIQQMNVPAFIKLYLLRIKSGKHRY